MSSPAILFTAITVVFSISEIYCDPDPIPEADFRSILELAQHQSANKDREVNDDRYETSHEENPHHYGSLKSNEILELLQKATQDKEWRDNRNYDNDYVERKKEFSNKHRNRDNTDNNRYYLDLYKELNENELNDGVLYGYQSNVKNRDKYNDDDERYKHSRYNQEALEQLLSQNVFDKKHQGKPRYRLTPNNLVGSSELKSDRAEDANLGSYSKVYVILNPKAIQKSANKGKLNNLLANILSLTSSSHGLEQEKNNRETYYKGFSVLPGLLARRARDTREMYGGKDSLEEEFKPKRSRSERGSGGGGGGGAGGRTAIPYIRHRGDIYERDN